jgi:type II secretory pathway pseudopilin PulG
MRPSRHGFTLIESCAAAAMLAVALGVLVALLTSVVRQRQGAARHAQAMIVADNLLERLTAEPYAAITAERAEVLRLASNVAELLPQGRAEIKITDAAGRPDGKRIEVEVSWRATDNGPPSKHQVATWVYEAAAAVAYQAEGTK